MIHLELFPCSGGMAEGFRRAGIHFDMAVDKDKDACDSYEKNLGHRPVQLDAHDFLAMVRRGWRTEIGLFVADPPCVSWSRAGSRKGTSDERDCLEPTVELIALLRPRAFVIANVPGLDDGPNWPVVQRLIGGLAQHGYCVADFRNLDAADYGVPQHRVRPFWFGHPQGTPCLRWPDRTHGDPDEIRQQLSIVGTALLPWVTCKEALGHLPPDELGRPIKMRRRPCNGKVHGTVPDRPARVVGTSNLCDGNVIVPSPQNKARTLREHVFDEPARTVRASRSNSERLLLPPPASPHQPAGQAQLHRDDQGRRPGRARRVRLGVAVGSARDDRASR